MNLGRLGFLAEVDVPELPDALSAIDQHQFTTEPRAGVSAEFSGQHTMAFNDIDLARIPGKGTSAAVELWVEGNPFVRYSADAVIVAMTTAGRAIVFSGVTVAIGLLALVVLPVPFMR